MSFFGLGKRSHRSKSPSSQTDNPNKMGLTAPPDESDRPDVPAKRNIDWRVLFLGSDPLWFRQTERDVLCLQPNWLCQLAENGAVAAKFLTDNSFNAIVVEDTWANFTELKKLLQTDAGKMICLARCDFSERAAVARWQSVGAIPLAEDSDAPALVAALKRAERLQDWMSNPSIKKLLPQLKTLPAAPDLYSQVSAELVSPNGSMAHVARLISQDPIMSAKILQVVNSAFFGMPREVTEMSEAIMVMGTERVRSLILLAGVFSQYDASECPEFSVESVWGHSVQVGNFARTIAIAELKNAHSAEAAFTAGLLHDIGKLILAGNLPQMYATVRRLQSSKNIGILEAETTVLGVTLAELGACLLGTWRLPLPILEAIAWHQRPRHSKEKGFSLLTAVHAANALACEHQSEQDLNGDNAIDNSYLLRMGIADGAERWKELCESNSDDSESLKSVSA